MAEPDNLTPEVLRRLHSKLDDIQGEMRLRFTGVETRLAAVEQHLSAFHAEPSPESPTRLAGHSSTR